MKIEFDYPEDEVILKYLHGPTMLGGPAFRHLPEDHPSKPWLAYVKSIKCPTYFGASGLGMTPQVAVNDAVRQVREYVARHPQGAYNVNAGVPAFDLDLSDVLKDL